MSRSGLVPAYMAAVITAAFALVLVAAARITPDQLSLALLALALATIGLGSRVTLRLPSFKSEFSLSDAFIFVTVLQFGGEAGVLLAAAEGYVSSFRVTKKPATRAFNAAALTCSTSLTVWTLRACFGPLEGLARGGLSPRTLGAMAILGVVQHLSNSSLVAAGGSLRSGEDFWPLWRRCYLWAGVPYVAAASSAVLTVKLVQVVGPYALLVTAPIIAILYLTYTTYIKNMEASAAQAEQARRHLAELQESEERFRSAFDNAAIGMALASTEGRWLKVNRALCEMLGYGEAELLAAEVGDFVQRADVPAAMSQLRRIVTGQAKTEQLELRCIRRDGQEMWTLVSIARIRDPQTQSIQLNFQIQDITERKKAEQQLMHDAFHDSLTGLPNRALFMDRLKQALDRARRARRRQFAVLFLDLDRFKVVNDSLGHSVGDQLLIGIAHRLEAHRRPGDTVARLGGDEFTILLEDVDDVRDAIHIADRIADTLARPFNLEGHEVFTTASIGIAPSSTGYERPDDILRDADTAMYRAKSLGKARHEVFDRAMHARAMNLLQLESDLRRAVERREFVVHYQPIVSLRTGAVEGFEALVRWLHPEQGFVSPLEFIPLAEESGLIGAIGAFVLRESCGQLRRWAERFPERGPLSVAVNISGKQCNDAGLVEQIWQILAETGADPHSLKLEITESAVMDNVDTAITMMRRLGELGIALSIDDFGTGYSSLSHLHRFPASTLKVDRSFVMGMSLKPENVEIVRTIVMLARTLGMSVIAEGIETEEQLGQLQNLGCEHGQGYLFSSPVSAAAATALLASDRVFPVERAQAVDLVQV